MRHRLAVVTVAVLLSILATAAEGCTAAPSVSPPSGPGTEAVVTPGPTQTPPAATRSAAYSAVESELTDFLAAWVRDGYAAAARGYLTADEQPTADAGPVLTRGTVTAMRPGEWSSASRFVVEVDLDLTFAGDAGAWGNGVNSRFVTVESRSGSVPYVLSFATGP